MKTKSPKWNKFQNKENIFLDKFQTKVINKIAEITKYKKRKTGKIKAKDLIIGFMIMVSKKQNTYESWSQEVSLLSKSIISKQAIEERMQPETTDMIKMVLEKELEKNIKSYSENYTFKFNSIKLEDSTTLNLPKELSTIFPGNVSKGKNKSQCKIDALYNFTKNSFDFMNLHSFTNNDQSLSSDVLEYVNSGDLLLRDMGYLVLDTLDKLDKKGVYFISQKSSRIKVYAKETNDEIDLRKVLRKKGFFDQEVLVGKKKKIKMRLVINPLPTKQVAERKRKAKQDRDKRLNHSEEYYELLGYSIFITNIPKSLSCAEEISKLYGLRWHIEIIFKSWKSYFSLEKLIPSKCKNPNRIYSMIYLWLLYILLFHTVWMNQNGLYLQKGMNLSILKMAKFYSENFYLILTNKDEEQLKQLMLSKCKYDKRNDRLNLMQKYEKQAA